MTMVERVTAKFACRYRP